MTSWIQACRERARRKAPASRTAAGYRLAAFAPLLLAGCGYAAIGVWLATPDSDDDDPNGVPFVNVTTPSGTQAGDVALAYFLTDPEGDAASIAVTYRWSADGVTFGAVTPATEAATGSDGTTGLAAAATGTPHTYVWDSMADAGAANGWALLTVVPIQPATGATGDARSTGAFEVRNFNVLPTVAVTTPSGNQSNSVPVSYTLTDPESDAADLTVEWSVSTDGGGTWSPYAAASEVPGAPSEGITGLVATPGGTLHVFVWNAFADVGGINALARLRFTPSDPGPPLRTGTAVATGSFNVLNQLIGTVIGGGLTVLDSPRDVAVDASGNLYIADTLNHRVQCVNLQSTAITVGGVTIQPNQRGVLAGTSTAGFNGDNQLATGALLNFPRDVAVDGNGHVFVADTLNHRIRRIDAVTGFITTVAGTGAAGRGVDGSLATASQVHTPSGIDFDASGNLYVADTGNHWLRAVNYQSSTITLAGTAIAPNVMRRIAGSAIALPGSLGDGGAASSALLDTPWDVAVDGAAVHVADTNNHAIRTVNTGTASITVGKLTIAGGNIDTIAGTNGTKGGTGDGGAATSARLNLPRGVDVHPTGGHVYVADTDNGRLRVVNASAASTITLAGVAILSGDIDTIAGGGAAQIGPGANGGDGGPSTSAFLTLPEGVAVLAGGHPAIADTGDNRVRGVNVGGSSITLAGVAIAAGEIENLVGQLATGLRVQRPAGLERTGNTLYVADQAGHKVVRLDFKTGLLTLVAGTGASGFGGDGGASSKAAFSQPADVALAGAGIYVADAGNNRVRAVNTGAATLTLVGVSVAAGNVATVAGGGIGGDGGAATSAALQAPGAVLVDAAGLLVISETGDHRLRTVNGSNTINTLTGFSLSGFVDGTLAAARYNAPGGIALDGNGNVLVADTGNHAIRYVNRGASAVTIVGVVVPAGQVGTIAGIPPGTGPLAGFNGDNQVGTSTRLFGPTDVAILPSGDVVLVDSGNQRIRRVNASSGLVSTIGGTGTAGFNSDGIPPVNAQINVPTACAVDGQTPPNLFFADSENKRVRRFTP